MLQKEFPAVYLANNVESRYVSAQKTVEEDAIIAKALDILKFRLENPNRAFQAESPKLVADYLSLRIADEPREHFCAMFLTTKHTLISFEVLFSGTINSATVHPREVVKRALELNAAAIVLAHNHPSGDPEPSDADKNITDRIVEACKTVDIRVLDHVVVGLNQTVSFAERGFMASCNKSLMTRLRK